MGGLLRFMVRPGDTLRIELRARPALGEEAYYDRRMYNPLERPIDHSTLMPHAVYS